MAELHVQIDRNTIEYEITASDGDCSHPKTYKASISPSTVGSFGEIRSKDYTLYTHGIIGYYEKNKNILIEKFSSTSESDLLIELIIHISNIKIDLIGTDNHEVYLTYTKDDCDRRRDIDVYFSKNDNEPFDIPILFKYGDKFFAPKDKNSYFIRWNEIKELEKYTQSNSNELNDYITGIYNILTEVDISQTSDYGIGFKDKPFFECNDKKFSTKRFSVSNKSSNSDKTYKTLTHKHCGYDGIEHKPRIGNIHQFNGCKFDNKHITEVKNNNTINEVIVLYPKDDNNHKDPRLILLNEASLGYGATTYGYYNLSERPDPCKGYTFVNFQNGCGFGEILSDDEPTYCIDSSTLRGLISTIPKGPIVSRKLDPDDCKCPESAVEVKKIEHDTDSLTGKVEEESQELDDETTSDFSKKPVGSNYKVTFKKGEKPKDANQYINREVKTNSNYTKVKYTANTFGRNSSLLGPWDLYSDTIFKLGKRTDNCESFKLTRKTDKCEDIKFKVLEKNLNTFFGHKFDEIDVYFLTQQYLALLIQFFDGTRTDVIRTGRKDQGGWKKLDEPLKYENDRQLLKVLKKIESNLDTFFLLIDKYKSYSTTDIQQVIEKTNPTLGVSPYQSSSISVNPKDLYKSNYKKCEHKIFTTNGSHSGSSYPLRLFMSDGNEIQLYGDSSANKKENLKYVHGEGQNTMDVFLFKNSSGWVPVLITHKDKVYQPKTDQKKLVKTNKWVHIPKGNKILSSVEKQENNIFLRKKLCILKKQVIENTKHLLSQKTTNQPPPAAQPGHTSQHGKELGVTKDPLTRSELGQEIPHVQAQATQLDGPLSSSTTSQHSHTEGPSVGGLEPELSSRGLVGSEQVRASALGPNGDSGSHSQEDSVSQGTGQGPGTPPPQPTGNGLERERRVDETPTGSLQNGVQREEETNADGQGRGGSGSLGAGVQPGKSPQGSNGEKGEPGPEGPTGARGPDGSVAATSETRTEATASSSNLENTDTNRNGVQSQLQVGGGINGGRHGGGAMTHGERGAKGGSGSSSSTVGESSSSPQTGSQDGITAEKVLEIIKKPEVYASASGTAGVGVIATAGAVVYKKCFATPAIVAGTKAAAKVAASAASGI